MHFKPTLFSLWIVLLLGTITGSHAQEFSSTELPFPKEEKMFLIAKGDTLVAIGETQSLYTIGNKIIRHHSVEKEVAAASTEVPVNFEHYTPIAVKDNTYFVENGLGRVYQWSNNRFERLDKSFSFRNHFGSSLFEHQGQIYNYGGYGFWNFRDFMIRYSEKMREWNIHVHPTKEVPPGRQKHFFYKTKDKFIAFGGEGSNGFLKDIIAFDFTQNKFEVLGEINPDFPFAIATRYHAHKNNNRYYLMDDFQWLKLNFKDFTFQLTDKIPGLSEQTFVSNLLIVKDTLYFISFKTGKHRLNSIPLTALNTLFGPPKNLIELNRFNLLGYVLIALFGLLMLRFAFVVLRWRNIKKTTPLLQNRYLTYKKSILIFTEEEKTVFECLLQTNGVSSKELAQLQCYTEYSKSYRSIAALNDIKSLGEKIESDKAISKVLQLEKLTDDDDRRHKRYKLKGQAKVYRGWVNHYFRF